jgi:predicted DNA-binding transcriptional regulator YafY
MNFNIIETIKQAARQRKILKIVYIETDGTSEGWRNVEPYSFRDIDGKTSFFAWDIEKNGIRRFILERIQQAKTTNSSFVPRYPIEI